VSKEPIAQVDGIHAAGSCRAREPRGNRLHRVCRDVHGDSVGWVALIGLKGTGRIALGGGLPEVGVLLSEHLDYQPATFCAQVVQQEDVASVTGGEHPNCQTETPGQDMRVEGSCLRLSVGGGLRKLGLCMELSLGVIDK
jgi:hypothetical protein